MKKEEIDLLSKMVIFYWQNNNISNNQEEWFISQEIIKQLILPVVGVTLKEKQIPTFDEWLLNKGIGNDPFGYIYKGKLHSWRQLDDLYKKEFDIKP